MGLTKSGAEHRRFQRIAVEMPVHYRIMGEGRADDFHHSTTTNISREGLAFVSPISVAVTARIELNIVLPDDVGILKAEATVVRVVREIHDEEAWEYGVQFDVATISNQRLLDEFLRSIDVVPLLKHMVKLGATDLHLSVNTPAMVRIQRQLQRITSNKLSPKVVEALVFGTLSQDLRNRLRTERQLDFPLMIPRIGRWRVNVHYQKGFLEGVFHRVDFQIPTTMELGLPDVVRNVVLNNGGLIAVTGGARSGKSSTMAALVGMINDEEERVIITFEDPIEFIHESNKSVIKQREVGNDVPRFAAGLRHALRQDPDVVVLDRIPDLDTMEVVLHIASTGRLVIAAFPTPDAVTTLNHITSFFPYAWRSRILHILAASLNGVVSQWLLPSADGSKLVMANEVMTLNEHLRQAIRTDKLQNVPNLMLNCPGSIRLDAHLRTLVLQGAISLETASHVAQDPDGLRRAISERR